MNNGCYDIIIQFSRRTKPDRLDENLLSLLSDVHIVIRGTVYLLYVIV